MHQGTDSNDYILYNEPQNSFKPSILKTRLKNSQSLLNDIKEHSFEFAEELTNKFEISNSITDDKDLLKLDLDNVEFPIFKIPSHNLAIREEGLVPKAAIVAIAGAILKVNVPILNVDDGISKRKNINEAKHYNVNESTCTTLFSKSAIKQLLLLHMLPINNDGSLLNVSFKKIAEYLKISVRTVKNNLDLLAAHNFIKFSIERKKYFDFTLLHYAAKHLERGYIKFSKLTFEKFISINDVNALRLGLRMYQRTIEELAKNKTNFRHSVAPNFIYDEISSILPKYTSHPKAIKNLTALLSDIFETAVLQDEDLFFVLSHEDNPECHQLLVHDAVNETIVTLVNNGLEVFDKKDKEDLLQLMNQYGMVKTLHTIYSHFLNKKAIELLNTGEHSFGMLLRSTLKLDVTAISTSSLVFSN